MLLNATGYRNLAIGAAYVGLAALLLAAALRNRASTSAPCALEGTRAWLQRWPSLVPVGMGLMAGLKVCPPLMLAFADAADSATLADSLLLFLTFFLGTSIYFIPISLLGAFGHVQALRIIGRFTAVIVGLYYLFAGILMVAGGVT